MLFLYGYYAAMPWHPWALRFSERSDTAHVGNMWQHFNVRMLIDS
jgi:hypothetical protein